MNVDDLPAGTHVMSGRWVDTMKTPTVWRSKYTTRGYEEPQCDEGCFAATATIQGIRPHPWGPGTPLVGGSVEPTPEEPLRREGAQGGSGSSPLNWIPNRGVQGEPVQMILRSTYLLAGRLSARHDG